MAASEPFVLLDDSLHEGGGSWLYTQPRRIIVAHTPEKVRGTLAEIDAAAASGAHLAGFASYEMGLAEEPRLAPLMPSNRAVPLVWFGVFDAPQRLDEAAVSRWLSEHGADAPFQMTPPLPSWSRARYAKAFARVRDYIAAGDIYQANLTLRADFRLYGTSAALYAALRQRQRVAYGAFIRAPGFDILSLSPELFLRTRGREAETLPMKGTQKRGAGPEEDWARRRHLETDAKSRAENLMIVDLMRNDLGRLAEPGSVAVPDLFSVESYRTVLQMTSRVTARLRAGIQAGEMLAALMSPGSVTGAPKIRAQEIIAELEDAPRDIYCGAIGQIGPDGLTLNVAIRTVLLVGESGTIGIGSGVVADSDGDSEYDECLLKMRFLTDLAGDFALFETALVEAGSVVLAERHIARMTASAVALGFRFDAAALRALFDQAAAQKAGGPQRLRVVLTRDGTLSHTLAPHSPTERLRAMLSPERVSSADPLMAHKTTRRALYDGERARLAASHGVDEALFLNEAGEVAEGSFTNIFVRRGETLLTPPLSAGLLPGTLRAELLASGAAREATLRATDLRGEFYLGNSVRGLVPATLLDGEETAAAQISAAATQA